MTFDNLRSYLEKSNRRSAILDADFKILWDKDDFFSSWKVAFPNKGDFFDKKEVIISLGADKAKIPVSVTKFTLSGGETRYVCEAFDRETVSELTAKSEISELLKNYLAEIRNKVQQVNHYAGEGVKNKLIINDNNLLSYYKSQESATLDLLALSTNLEYYLETFSYSDSYKEFDVYNAVDCLVKMCNEQIGHKAIALSSKESVRFVKISARAFNVAFLNLIQNALLYSKSDSKIKVSIYYDNESATVSVINEIDENLLPVSEKIQLGIGIPLVERIVTGAGGKESREKEGSTYKASFSLPLYVRDETHGIVFEQSTSDFGFGSQAKAYVERYLNQIVEKQRR